MKCPKCKVEMEPGILYGEGQAWTNSTPLKATYKFLGVLWGHRVIAHRCPKCSKLELYAPAGK